MPHGERTGRRSATDDVSQDRPGNQILKMLPECDYRSLAKHLEGVTLPRRKIVARPYESPEHAYFPTSSVFSSVILLESGGTVEAWTTGNEGMTGTGLLVGSGAGMYQVLQQVPGHSLRVRADAFRRVVGQSEALSRVLQRYALVLADRGAQNAACNQHHTIEERTARWLLETSERLGTNSIELTQDLLAEMLGVRRQSVNLTLRVLSRAGLIRSGRGTVAILDRPGVEQVSCECYRVVRESYDRLMRAPAR